MTQRTPPPSAAAVPYHHPRARFTESFPVLCEGCSHVVQLLRGDPATGAADVCPRCGTEARRRAAPARPGEGAAAAARFTEFPIG